MNPSREVRLMVDDEPGASVVRAIVGRQLRALRLRSGVTRHEAALAIDASDAKISRWELGRNACREADVATLLDRYGVVDAEERSALLHLARYANGPDWWQRVGGIVPDWFEEYVGLEPAASQIRTYDAQFVPGLLQTEDYARAVTVSGRVHRTDDEARRRVRLRMARQRAVARSGARLWAVIDEGALHRPVGGHAVMRQQLARLLALQERPDVAIQVLPLAVGWHAGEAGAFSFLRLADPDLPDVVHVEQLNHADHLYQQDKVEQYKAVFDELTRAALTPRESTVALASILQRLGSQDPGAGQGPAAVPVQPSAHRTPHTPRAPGPKGRTRSR